MIKEEIGLLSKSRSFYRKHLAQLYVFQQLKKLFLHFYFKSPELFKRSQLIFSTNTIKFNVKSIDKYTEKHKLKKNIIETESIIEIPGPKFIGQYPITPYSNKTVQLLMPSTEFTELNNVILVGGTDLIICNDSIIFPKTRDIKRDVIPAELFGKIKINPNNETASFKLSYKIQSIDNAISLLGNCNGNYAHWLTEVLPKIILIDQIPEYHNTPLIIDGWIHPVFLETIKTISKQDRKIFLIERFQEIKVKTVIDISATAYTPPELRGFEKGHKLPPPTPEIFYFSKGALEKLRSASQNIKLKSNRTFGKRIYLNRTKEKSGNPRFIKNTNDIEKLIEQHGFINIDPSEYSFPEQINIFRDATHIVAPVGAALANTVFTPPGCLIIALAAYYENANYYYFSNLMGVLGHELYYVLGPQEETSGHIAHRSYSVNLEALSEALNQLVGSEL